ncbi:MAG: hypothetical protein JXR77_13420 [Lentisphaeria bacterium]|nr:hypothetical protein [Lentisphaeria bacterium]
MAGWPTEIVGCLLTLAPLCAARAGLLDGALAAAFAGESTPNGASSCAIVPAPEGPEGAYALRLSYRLDRHQAGDWIDVAMAPAPPVDLSAAPSVRLAVRAEQEADFLVLKLVDPQNPGANQAAFEGPLLFQGGALPAARWVELDVPLPAAAARRDGLTYIGFYIAAANAAVPLGRDLVFHVGRFPFTPPSRPPWPPRADGQAPAGARGVFSGPLEPSGPWVLVGGKDNQTDHLAAFRDGGVVFAADAPGWNEFLWSDPRALVLAPRTTYRLQFDYHVLAAPAGGPEATFYSLVRAKDSIREDVGWQRWQGTAGTQGRRLLTFTTHDKPDYHLIFGVRHHGAIRIENIRLEQIQEP